MSPPDKLKVLVVDDHSLFRKGSKLVIESFQEVKVVKEAENGEEALEHLNSEHFDVVFLDLEMPGIGGEACAISIIKDYPESKIIMLSSHGSLKIIARLIEIGVHSYLIKDSSPEEVHQALTAVLQNDFYYNQIVAKALREKINRNGIPISKKSTENQSNQMTLREVEILQLICQELTMKEIGEKLFLSEQTVHTHRKNLMKKINVNNTVGLVKFAFEKGFLSL